jgi:integrase
MRKYLSAKDLGKLTKRGRYAAGPNLYLQISEWGTRAWIFRYRIDGRHRHMGLGAFDLLTLQEARERAHAARRQLKIDGIDPIEAKRTAKRERMLASARDKTFKDVALDYISAHEDHWRGDGSRLQWLQSFEKHVFPKIGDTPVGDIDVAGILNVLDPMRNIPETAKRARNRIASILDWAAARDLRPHDNPAKRPNLLPKRKRRVEHFAAMPYADVPAFIAELRQRPEGTARMLEFLILTAARPGEVLGMCWSEVDGNVWTVPSERMKGGREHRVPLSERAVELLAAQPREGKYVFLGRRTGAQPHPMVLVTLLRRMGRDVTAHGFRSSFRDWAAETTAYPNHVVEQALAHAIGNGVEAAYRRGDLFEKRRRLMDDWARYCSRPPASKGEVVTLRGVS